MEPPTHKPHSAFNFNICCWFAAAAVWHSRCWSWWNIQTCKAMFEFSEQWKVQYFSELLSVKSAIACCTGVHAGQCPRHPSSLLFNFVRLFYSDQPGFGDQVHLWKNQTTIWEANIVVDGRRVGEGRRDPNRK